MARDVIKPVVIRAYLRRYSRKQIETALDQALKDHAAGVRITSLSFEGGSSSGTMTATPEHIIELMTECLELLDADRDGPAPRPIGSIVRLGEYIP